MFIACLNEREINYINDVLIDVEINCSMDIFFQKLNLCALIRYENKLIMILGVSFGINVQGISINATNIASCSDK